MKNIFRKLSPEYRDEVELINFSSLHVSTGQLENYITRLLLEEGFSGIYYRARGNRFYLYAANNYNKNLIQYFKDRCPAMIEEACKKMSAN